MYHIITRVTAFGEKREAQGDDNSCHESDSSNSATDNNSNNKNTTCVCICVHLHTLDVTTFDLL